MPKRVRMVLDRGSLDAQLPQAPQLPGQRSVTSADGPALGALALAAFEGGPDDEGETLDDQVSEMGRTLVGEYGPVFFDASAVVVESDRIVAAILITLERGLPFVPYCLVEPTRQGRGIGTDLMVQGAHRLNRDGHGGLALATVEGGRATQLYTRLGFQVTDLPQA